MANALRVGDHILRTARGAASAQERATRDDGGSGRMSRHRRAAVLLVATLAGPDGPPLAGPGHRRGREPCRPRVQTAAAQAVVDGRTHRVRHATARWSSTPPSWTSGRRPTASWPGGRWRASMACCGARIRVARCGWARSGCSSPSSSRPSGGRAGGLPEQRSLVPARRHHRERHGSGLRPAAPLRGPGRSRPARRRCRPRFPRPPGSAPSTFAIPTGIRSRFSSFRRTRAMPAGTAGRAASSSASTTPPSWWMIPRPVSPSTATRWASGWRARVSTSVTEQEHLNNVRGARLRITGLRATAGPGDRISGVPRARGREAVSGR